MAAWCNYDVKRRHHVHFSSHAYRVSSQNTSVKISFHVRPVTKPPSTLAELAQRAFVNFPERPLSGAKRRQGIRLSRPMLKLQNACKTSAARCSNGGLERGGRVAILGDNRREWAIADLACQMSGVISVPIYATLPANQVETILLDCGAKGASSCRTKRSAPKSRKSKGQLPELEFIWSFDEFRRTRSEAARRSGRRTWGFTSQPGQPRCPTMWRRSFTHRARRANRRA